MTTSPLLINPVNADDRDSIKVVGVRMFQTLRSQNAPNFPPSRPGDGKKALVLA